MQTTLAECCASFMAQCSHTNHVSIKRIRLNVITGGNIFENVKLSNIRDMTHQDNRSNSCFYYNVVGPFWGVGIIGKLLRAYPMSKNVSNRH